MRRLRMWRVPLFVLFVAATIFLAGGLAVGSNMGFKLNKAIVLGTAAGGHVGDNWTSIPYNNPYVNFGGFCTQTGLPSGPTGPTDTTIQYRNLNGSFAPVSCHSEIALGGSSTAFATLPPGFGLQIHPGPSGGISNIIIVGSHNPTLTITLQGTAPGQIGNYWFSVPYHTTAVTAHDLCVQMGIPAPGGVGVGTVQVLNATTGAFTPTACPGAGAQVAPFILELGKMIQIRSGLAANLPFIPAHF
jgi:hypothetical protein